MNYQHIARLAELASEISDTTNTGNRLDVDFAFSCIACEPEVRVALHSWTPDLSAFYFETNSLSGYSYTTAELIQILEQIKACGFRDEQEVAA